MALRPAYAVLVALTALAPLPAQAQDFFQSLFGYGAQRSYSGYPISPYRLFRPYEQGLDDANAFQQSGAVRTLCVRMCDGFYFPISYAAPRSALARDADACTASCGADARLFYHPTQGGDAESMVDLSGLAYASLPNAFKYRKTLVQGCSCRPQPWSETELQRHRGYAQPAIAGPASAPPAQEIGNPAPQPPANADPLRVPAPDRQRAMARPDPVTRQAAPPSWAGMSPPGAAKSGLIWPGDRP